MSEHTYTLREGFTYAHKGEEVVAKFITLTAANYEQMPHFTPIKQAFMAAIKDISVDAGAEVTKDTEADSEITGAQVMQLLYSWSGELTKVLLSFEQLLKCGAGKVDGETNLTIPLIRKLSMDDMEGLLGDYIANFIAPSLMNGQ